MGIDLSKIKREAELMNKEVRNNTNSNNLNDKKYNYSSRPGLDNFGVAVKGDIVLEQLTYNVIDLFEEIKKK